MATLNKMTGFKVYQGTKDTFISSGKATQYADAIVFITGGAGNEKNSCIFAQGTYFANITELIKAINYVKGISVSGTTYNAAVGGGYVAFEATDPSTVSVNANSNGIAIGLTEAFINKVNSTATNLGTGADAANSTGTAFARIASLAADLAALTGSSSGSIAEQIAAVKSAIEGELGTSDSKTLAAINDELDAIDAKWASYVSKAELEAIEDTKANGTNVNVSVTTKGGKVTAVTVNEQGLTNALNLKANAADVYTKADAETMAQGKVDALANGAVKANADAIAVLNGNDTAAGSVAKQIKDAINAFAGSADGDTAIENVTELLNYVSGVDGSKTLSEAIAQIADNKGKIETLNGGNTTAGSVAKAVKDAIDSEVSRAEAAYAVKGTETVASGAAARAEEAYNLAGTKATAAEAKAQAVGAISEIAEATQSDAEGPYVKVTVKTKAGSVSAVEVDDAGVKTYADLVAGTAKSEAISAVNTTLESYYTKAEVDAMWMWEEL